MDVGKLFESKSLRFIAAALVVFNGFFPALWILLTSLKTETELVRKPITWLPHDITLGNYTQAFTDQPLLRYLFNSLRVAGFAFIGSTRPALSRAPISSLLAPHRFLPSFGPS